MTTETFDELRRLCETEGAEATLDRLIETLDQAGEHHRLFDARLMKQKLAMGLPVTRPTSFDDVPAERRDEFEQTYIAAAREVGERLLAEGKLGAAHMYFHAIRETEPIARAIEAEPPVSELDDRVEELINIAFFQGVHPVKGVELMLATHGTCSTITSLDQQMAQLTPEVRQGCAALMVRTLYQDLLDSVRRDLAQRAPEASTEGTLAELIAAQSWLVDDGNYHIDVSHLNSVVRFARSLDPAQPELRLARDLTVYGARLDPRYQYAGEPPFSEFFEAHRHYFDVLLDIDREAALDAFRQPLAGELDETDRHMTAYVLVDLLMRIDRLDEAVDVAQAHLLKLDGEYGFSFADLCRRAGRLEALQRSAEQRGDLVSFTGALIDSTRQTPVR